MSFQRSLSFYARAGLGVLMLIAPAAPASAATMTISFNGSLTAVSSAVASQFAVGDTFTGTFVIDTDAPGSACGAFCQSYSSPLTVMSATVGSYNFSATVALQLTEFSTFYDEYSINAYGASLSGPPVNGMSPSLFFITLTDPTTAALSTIHTLTPPVLGDYAERSFGIFFETQGRVEAIAGTITSLSEVQTPPTAVPEPTSLLLLGTGITALAARVRRRRNTDSTQAR
jgi:hypothetical protein